METPLETWLHFWASAIGAIGGILGAGIAAYVSGQVRRVHTIVNSRYSSLEDKLTAQTTVVSSQATTIDKLYQDIAELKADLKAGSGEGKH